jgi:hypothetical protein
MSAVIMQNHLDLFMDLRKDVVQALRTHVNCCEPSDELIVSLLAIDNFRISIWRGDMTDDEATETWQKFCPLVEQLLGLVCKNPVHPMPNFRPPMLGPGCVGAHEIVMGVDLVSMYFLTLDRAMEDMRAKRPYPNLSLGERCWSYLDPEMRRVWTKPTTKGNRSSFLEILDEWTVNMAGEQSREFWMELRRLRSSPPTFGDSDLYDNGESS